MTEPSLEELILDLGDLPLNKSILISSDPLLISVGQDIAEGDLKEFIFIISLLGATIQGGGMRERSNVYCQLFVDLYSCPTEIITTFYSLSISGTTISRYPSIILIMFGWMFFFSKNMVCISSVSAFMANVLNSIIKLAMCFMPYLNVSIFYLVSAVLLLPLNMVLISLTNSFQS